MTKNVLFIGKSNTKDVNIKELMKVFRFSPSDTIEFNQFTKGFKSSDPICKLIEKADSVVLDKDVDPYVLSEIIIVSEGKPVLISTRNLFKKVFLIEEE